LCSESFERFDLPYFWRATANPPKVKSESKSNEDSLDYSTNYVQM
jgi:hypothetical protein